MPSPDLCLQLEAIPSDTVSSAGSCAFSKACAGPLWAAGLYNSKWIMDLVQPEGADPASHTFIFFFYTQQTWAVLHMTNKSAEISVVGRQSVCLVNELKLNSWCLACSLWDVSTLQPDGHTGTAHYRISFSCPLLVPSVSRKFKYSNQLINRWPLHTSAKQVTQCCTHSFMLPMCYQYVFATGSLKIVPSPNPVLDRSPADGQCNPNAPSSKICSLY